MENFSEKMSFYHYSICYVCKKSDKPLKKCSNCKVLHYCSKEHQAQDWPSHKKMCKAMTNLNRFIVIPADVEPDEYKKIKVSFLYLCVIELERDLEPHELDMVLYSKNCSVCYTDKANIVCDVCLGAAYCSKEHQEEHKEQHQLYCQKLKLLLNSGQAELPQEMLEMNLPAELLTLPGSITELLKKHKFQRELQPMDICLLSDLYTYPATILNALEKSKFVENRLGKRDSLTIHVIVDKHNDVDLQQWNATQHFLSNWITNLKIIQVIIMGSELENAFEVKHFDRHGEFTGIVMCLNGKYSDDYRDLKRPDIVFALNNVVRTFTGALSNRDILSFIKYKNVPLILSSWEFNALEGDIAKFPSSQIKFYIKPKTNAYASLKPMHYYDMNVPVVFENNYIAVIARK